MKIDKILKELEWFYIEIARDLHPHYLGLQDETNTEKIVKKFAYVFTLKNIDFVKRKLDVERKGLQKRKLNLLYLALVSGWISQKTAKISDESSKYTAKASIIFKKKKIPYLQVSNVLQNTAKREDRKKLSELTKPIKKKLLEYSKNSLRIEVDSIKKLGYKDYFDYYKKSKDLNFVSLSKTYKSFLLKSEPLYLMLLKKYLGKIKVPVEDAATYDVPFMFRVKEFDSYFSKKNLMPFLNKTLLRMGFDLENQHNIDVDISERPKKRPRAYCYPIEVPDDIKLVTKPSGGPSDYESLFHEAGHAEHYAYADPNLPYEFKQLGESAITENFSYLFEHLLNEFGWLKEFTDMSNDVMDEYLMYQKFQKLYMIRRYVAKLIYEIKLHSGNIKMLNDKFESVEEKYSSAADMYADILGKSLHIEHDPINYLLDLDSGFYSADYCTAWLTEAMSRHYLKKKFGVNWFFNKKSGSFLIKMFSVINKYPVERFVKKMLGEKLTIRYLEREFRTLSGL